MSFDLILNMLGLVIGVVMGFYFERRSSRQTREQNAELEKKLRVLREGIYAVGRGDSDGVGAPGTDGSSEIARLEDELRLWIVAYQGPDGTLPRARVVRRFLDSGATLSQINAVLAHLDERKVIALGDLIEIR